MGTWNSPNNLHNCKARFNYFNWQKNSFQLTVLVLYGSWRLTERIHIGEISFCESSYLLLVIMFEMKWRLIEWMSLNDAGNWIKQDRISNIRILRHNPLSIIAISYIFPPCLQRKLSVCKQRGERGERVVTPPLEGVVHSCSWTKTSFTKYASSRGSTLPSLSFPLSIIMSTIVQYIKKSNIECHL